MSVDQAVSNLGFSVALTELFRLKFDSESKAKAGDFSLSSTVDDIGRLTETKGNVSGQEKRDALVGRRFSFQALLQSDVGLQKRLPDGQWEYLLKFIFRLASEKSWLRRECGAAVHEYLVSPNASKLSDVRVRMVVDELIDAKLATEFRILHNHRREVGTPPRSQVMRGPYSNVLSHSRLGTCAELYSDITAKS